MPIKLEKISVDFRKGSHEINIELELDYLIFSHFSESQDSESLRNHSKNTAVSSSFKMPGLIQDSGQVKT